MPRLREAYSLYKRRTPKGKTVYYFRVYDDNGNRLPGRSTGKTNKKGARDYCDVLKEAGRLTKPDLPPACSLPTLIPSRVVYLTKAGSALFAVRGGVEKSEPGGCSLGRVYCGGGGEA